MATRNMEQIADTVGRIIPKDYDIDSSEILRLMKMARDYDPNEAYNCIVTAFYYGFAMGHRATRAGKVPKRI